MNLINPASASFQMKFVAGELEGLRKVLEYLWDGEQEAFNALLWCKSNYKEWPQMIMYCKRNRIKGKKLVELMQNESPDGGGYHLGWEFIHSRMQGIKSEVVGIKGDELLGN